jgi:hypothetical protein
MDTTARLLATLLVLLTALPAEAAPAVDTSSEAAYTKGAARALDAALVTTKQPGLAARVSEPLTVIITQNGEKRFEISLARPWAACTREPATCDDQTRDYLTKVAAQLASSLGPQQPVTRDQLRIIVRNTTTLAMTAQSKVPPVTAPLGGDLVAVLVVDTPQTTRSLYRDELAALGLHDKAAFVTALANVRNEVGPLAKKMNLPLPDNGLGFLTPTHYYNGAFVSAPSEWTTAAKSMKSLMVSVPSDQIVLYGDNKGPESIAAFKAITAKMYGEADRPVSKTILQWTARGWTTVP